MYRIIILFIINCSLSQDFRGNHEKLRLIKSWKSLDFAFPNAIARQQAINRREFIPGKLTPIDFGIIPNQGRNKGKILVTIPRFQEGVPVTLGYITEKVSTNNNQLIAPYPNWEMNKLDKNCNHIISVFRIAIDHCNRLWVLDTGISVNERICPPKLLVYNITNDQLISSYEFPTNQFYNDSLFITPIVDIHRNKCEKAFVYIADVVRYQLIVYDHKHKKSWNIKNELFNAEKQHSNITINDETFNLKDGLFALTLSHVEYGDKYLFFHSLASLSENFVSTTVIKNAKLYEENPNASSKSFQRFSYERPSQSAAEILDRRGILFYSLSTETALACWNSEIESEFNDNTVDIVAENSETLQFITSMKINSIKGQRDQLWLMSTRYQKIMTGTINPNEVNFRIQAGYIEDLIYGTKCDPEAHYKRQYPNNTDDFCIFNCTSDQSISTTEYDYPEYK